MRTLLVVLSIKTINASCTFYDHRKLREEVKKYYHGESTCEDDAPFWNVSALTSLEGVFESLDYFYLDLSEWDVSNVGNFRNTFKDAVYYNGNISTWDMSSATDLTNMFLRSSSFNVDISSWNVEKVTDLGGTFYNASAFNQDISSWNVQKVTSWRANFGESGGDREYETFEPSGTSSMDDCTKFKVWDSFKEKNYEFTVLYQKVWDGVECPCIATSRTDLFDKIHGFIHNPSAFPCDLHEFDVSRVTSLDYMFCGHSSEIPNSDCGEERANVLEGRSLSTWNVQKVTSLEATFLNNEKVNFDFSNWNVRISLSL